MRVMAYSHELILTFESLRDSLRIVGAEIVVRSFAFMSKVWVCFIGCKRSVVLFFVWGSGSKTNGLSGARCGS